MQIFLDSANLEDIRAAAELGLIDGVTTNPTLIAKEGKDFKETVVAICRIVNGPVSAEVMNIESAAAMIEEAKLLSRWHKNVVVKVPCTAQGLIAARVLESMKIRTNVTLVFSANQVLLAAKAGAGFISPFVGRLDDAGEDGLEMIKKSLQIISNYGFKSRIIVASVRSPITVQRAAEIGAHVATVPFAILNQMIAHPLTDAGIARFKKDWESVKK